MVSEQEQHKFINLAKTKFSEKEQDWIGSKMGVVANSETENKFNILFGLVSRFIEEKDISWADNENEALEQIYPGFSKTDWNKQILARVLLMISLRPNNNKSILLSFFESAEMKEQIALYKGLYLLQNAPEFKNQMAEGIRTNMVNVFDAIAAGNPFSQKYLSESEWNQLILKSFFLERKLYKVQDVDLGKNSNLANMLQDYIKERWAASRAVSPEIWRMIDGYLREDVKTLFANKNFEGAEKKAITQLLEKNQPRPTIFWDELGEKY